MPKASDLRRLDTMTKYYRASAFFFFLISFGIVLLSYPDMYFWLIFLTGVINGYISMIFYLHSSNIKKRSGIDDPII